MIRTHIGSLTDDKVGAHVIVNACNPELGMGTGVSGAILKACGGMSFQKLVRTEWEDEFDERLEPSDCLLTTSGEATAFSWVLHVASVDYRIPDSETGGSSGPTRIRKCVGAVLSEAKILAEREGLVGKLVIGMPLLGAGHGGIGAVKSAAAMMEAICEWRRGEKVLFAAIVFATPVAQDARVVELAAERYGCV